MKKKPEMKSMLLAVFGHYDSRGGTMGVMLEARTAEAVKQAKRRYNIDGFGIEEPGDIIERTAYGMEARECDKQVHALMYQDTTPAEDDFMYIAELWYPEGVDLIGDLEDELRRVLKQGGEMEERLDETGLWPEMETTHHVTVIGDKKFERDEPVEESLIEESLRAPVQLELVKVPAEWSHERLEQVTAPVKAAMKVIEDRIGRGYWDDPEYKRLGDVAGETWAKFYKDAARAAARQARKLKKATTCRWDDDAYGFVILG